MEKVNTEEKVVMVYWYDFSSGGYPSMTNTHITDCT